MTGNDQADGQSPPQRPIRIVLADDHRVVRRGLQLVLDEEPDFEVIAQVGDVESVRRSLRTNPPDVLVLDLNMPGESTMDAIPELRAAAPDVQIVVLTMQDEPALAQSVMRAGARAYVLKEAADDELAHAIRLAAAGKSYLNRGLAGRMALERIRSGGWD